MRFLEHSGVSYLKSLHWLSDTIVSAKYCDPYGSKPAVPDLGYVKNLKGYASSKITLRFSMELLTNAL